MKYLVLVLTLAGIARAEPLDPANKDRAAQLVSDGSKRFTARDYQGALDNYDEAFRLYPSPKIHYNRALALDKLHREADAADELDRFVSEATDAPRDALEQARRMLATFDRTLGKIEVTSSMRAEVAVDDRTVGTTPVTLHAPVGPHAVHVTAAGYKPWKQDVVVVAGEIAHAASKLDPIDLQPALPPPPKPSPVVVVERPINRPPPETPHRSVLSRWWLWTAVGVVVAGGITTYAVTRSPAAPPTELGTYRPGI